MHNGGGASNHNRFAVNLALVSAVDYTTREPEFSGTCAVTLPSKIQTNSSFRDMDGKIDASTTEFCHCVIVYMCRLLYFVIQTLSK